MSARKVVQPDLGDSEGDEVDSVGFFGPRGAGSSSSHPASKAVLNSSSKPPTAGGSHCSGLATGGPSTGMVTGMVYSLPRHINFHPMELLEEMSQSPHILSRLDATLRVKQKKVDVDEYPKARR